MWCTLRIVLPRLGSHGSPLFSAPKLMARGSSRLSRKNRTKLGNGICLTTSQAQQSNKTINFKSKHNFTTLCMILRYREPIIWQNENQMKNLNKTGHPLWHYVWHVDDMFVFWTQYFEAHENTPNQWNIDVKWSKDIYIISFISLSLNKWREGIKTLSFL